MASTFLYIDGENLRHYLKMVLEKEKTDLHTLGLENMNYENLFDQVLKGIEVSKKYFYSAKLREHKDSLKKSKELILKQRVLKTNLEKQGFTFVMSGNVRGQTVQVNGKNKVIFKEKGVDVKIAVDLVSNACDKQVKTVVICSSDSDLQPAIAEVKKRGVEVIYLGFELNPNKGLSYTTDRTILIRNSEVIECYLSE
jgi:uncharacterized LabA/DUF88 family protein